MNGSARNLKMKNGDDYVIKPCTNPEIPHTREILKEQIKLGLKNLSIRSTRQRFASPVKELSEKQLDYLTNLDGINRVAWCATLDSEPQERGIGLARYFRLANDETTAEFAITILDEFQSQGIGYRLLETLIESARNNSIEILRGYILPDNKAMLSLSKKLKARIYIDEEDDNFMVADIPVIEREQSSGELVT